MSFYGFSLFQTRADLLQALIRNIPADSSLSKEKLGIQVIRLNYGMGDQNPIEQVRFYSKNSPNVAKVVRKEETSYLLPQR